MDCKGYQGHCQEYYVITPCQYMSNLHVFGLKKVY